MLPRRDDGKDPVGSIAARRQAASPEPPHCLIIAVAVRTANRFVPHQLG
jgi:hypothetical protein